MAHKSKWDFYGVKIIKQIVIEGEPDPNLLDEFFEDDGKQIFEESLLLVRAQSFEHAYKIAERKATEAEEPYQSIYGQQVTWKFIAAVDCFLIYDKLSSGAEVYSCFYTADESAKDFIDKQFRCDNNGCRKARHK